MLLIAIGANLTAPGGSDARDTCNRALAAMQDLEMMSFVAVSRWYRTRPVPADDRQPDYCNGVARFSVPHVVATPDPAVLMAALHRIEAAFGRTRSVANAARSLDLDLIDLDGLIRPGPSPVLPHPRAHSRAFVLRPILDIAPDWVHPVSRKSAAALLQATAEPHQGSTTEPLMPW